MRHFHIGAASGILAAATTGVVFAWRNASLTNKQYIQRVRFELATVVQPTTAQQATLELVLQSVFTANYTGGTDLVTAPRARLLDLQKVVSQTPTSVIATGNVRIAATGALAAGGGDVIDAQPWSSRSQQAPGAALGSAPSALVLEWQNPTMGLEHEDPSHGCMPLSADTGFIVRLPVALGVAFTAQFSAEVEWLE